MSQKTRKYISENWSKCIKLNINDVPGKDEESTLIGMPYPYTVPAVGFFDEIYYWDTYFTNVGLIIDGHAMQAKNNTDDMLYLVDKYGFMPNGNRLFFLNGSQPPFLSIMARDVYDYFKDRTWLYGAYHTLEKEYEFWMTKRITPVGLNKYGTRYPNEEKMKWACNYWKRRSNCNPPVDDEPLSLHIKANSESGWDYTPRWDYEAQNYAPVDLNSLMYMFEKNMEYFSEVIGNGQEVKWKELAEKRRLLMEKYMVSSDGLFYDYNFEKDCLSKVFSVASYYTMFANLASREQADALVNNLSRIEAEHGVLACEKNDVEGTYQWDYPNGWPCLQHIMIDGLNRYGYTEDALRIAQKYTKLVERIFDETENLWEKYNVVEGNINVSNEYKMPPMMGWSAGVYLSALDFCEKNK